MILRSLQYWLLLSSATLILLAFCPNPYRPTIPIAAYSPEPTAVCRPTLLSLRQRTHLSLHTIYKNPKLKNFDEDDDRLVSLSSILSRIYAPYICTVRILFAGKNLQ
jgi:hypothetical protein